MLFAMRTIRISRSREKLRNVIGAPFIEILIQGSAYKERTIVRSHVDATFLREPFQSRIYGAASAIISSALITCACSR